ncbi:hypothetical protein [Perlabentimonas gracilis]|uniref:hypothetical protein n=1 Tax=Perlabentimonas gracilis TaxID=2715279 RepID=UPI00140ADE6F|nr:hypothetical protein [Perlabentimonas gracilis]NHB69849.1 hypothetical protein [Perlabentimonas gracilis]
MRALLIFIIFFINVYNPFHLALTFGFNIAIFFFLSICKFRNVKEFGIIIITATIVLIWQIIVLIGNDSFSFFLIGKYSRILLSTLLLGLIIPSLNLTSNKIINILSAILFLHILAIGLQFAFPSLVKPMATIFNFYREPELLDLLNLRNLGLTGSYDFAALLSVFGIYVFYLQYKIKKKFLYLILFSLAFISCLRISRVAMIFGFLTYAYLSFKLIRQTSIVKKLFIIPFIITISIVIFNIVFPIIVGSLSFFKNSSLNKGFDISTANYSKSDENLLQKHLFFPETVSGIMFGLGIDVEGTDIGYIRTIFSIGIIGLAIILFQHLFMLVRVMLIMQKKIPEDLYTLIKIFVFFTIALLIINFKILLLYSRGAHELLILLFFSIITIYNKKTTTLILPEHNQNYA